MAQTDGEFAALDALTARIMNSIRAGHEATLQDAGTMNAPFPYGKSGRTKNLSEEDVLRAYIQAHINTGK